MGGCGKKCRNPLSPNTKKTSPSNTRAAETALSMGRPPFPSRSDAASQRIVALFVAPPSLFLAADPSFTTDARRPQALFRVPGRDARAREALERHADRRARGGAAALQRDRRAGAGDRRPDADGAPQGARGAPSPGAQGRPGAARARELRAD